MPVGRIWRQVASGLILMLLSPFPCFPAEVATGPTSAPTSAIIFDGPGSDRLLEEIEGCREELSLLRALEDKNFQLDEVRIEREAMLRERIGFLEKQQATLLKMNESAIQQAEVARKAGEGKWYNQLFTAGKWIGLGIVAGFAVGATR